MPLIDLQKSGMPSTNMAEVIIPHCNTIDFVVATKTQKVGWKLQKIAFFNHLLECLYDKTIATPSGSLVESLFAAFSS